jgi:membrane protein implicated in regulation of membrane protease activity
MVVIGLLLVAVGVLAVVAAVVASSGTAAYLGLDLNSATLFFLGVAATLAVIVGMGLTRAGAGRAVRRRREHRRLQTLERERRERQSDDEGREASDRGAADTRAGEDSPG